MHYCTVHASRNDAAAVPFLAPLQLLLNVLGGTLSLALGLGSSALSLTLQLLGGSLSLAFSLGCGALELLLGRLYKFQSVHSS